MTYRDSNFQPSASQTTVFTSGQIQLIFTTLVEAACRFWKIFDVAYSFYKILEKAYEILHALQNDCSKELFEKFLEALCKNQCTL